MDTTQSNHNEEIFPIQSVTSSLPNAIEVFDNLRAQIVDKKLLIFLDYDGTLTPIVAQPDQAIIPLTALALVNRLAQHHFVAIVTGRGKETIKHFMNISSTRESPISLLTSHGFNIECNHTEELMGNFKMFNPSRQGKIIHSIGKEQLPFLNDFKQKIEDQVGFIEGVRVENNIYTLSIHYRNVPEHLIKPLEMQVDDLLSSYDMLKKTYGKKVLEIRLNFQWDKGKAVCWLLQNLGYPPEHQEVFPIYLGDDMTDEDAFRDLRSYVHSLSIFVGMDEHRQTFATHRLRGPQEVYQLLELLDRI